MLVMALMLGSKTVYAYWVDEVSSDWTVTLTREVTLKVTGFSIESDDEILDEEMDLENDTVDDRNPPDTDSHEEPFEEPFEEPDIQPDDDPTEQ